MGLALGASLGLPGLLYVLGCEAAHWGLVLVEEPALKARAREGAAGISEEPPIRPAQRGGGLARKPRFPKGSAVGVGRSWALAARVAGGCREVCRGSLSPRPGEVELGFRVVKALGDVRLLILLILQEETPA